jgi:hypothetical protein
MGYLTTFTVYNDGCNSIPKNAEKFAEGVYQACGDTRSNSDFSCGHTEVICQKARHADDHAIYVHMGNTVTEVSAYSREFKELVAKHPDFAEALVKFVEFEAESLRRLLDKGK